MGVVFVQQAAGASWPAAAPLSCVVVRPSRCSAGCSWPAAQRWSVSAGNSAAGPPAGMNAPSAASPPRTTRAPAAQRNQHRRKCCGGSFSGIRVQLLQVTVLFNIRETYNMMQSQYVAHIDFLISCVINQQICVTKGESVYSTEEPVESVCLPRFLCLCHFSELVLTVRQNIHILNKIWCSLHVTHSWGMITWSNDSFVSAWCCDCRVTAGQSKKTFLLSLEHFH